MKHTSASRLPGIKATHLPAAGLIWLACGAAMAALAGCGGNRPGAPGEITATSTPTRQVQVTRAAVKPTPGSAATVTAVTLADGLENPWGLAFLPDGRMLVTERSGTMQAISSTGGVSSVTPVSGVPPVHASGQGGLLDVQVEPSPTDPKQPWIYWSFSEPGTGAQAGLNGTAVAKGRLVGHQLTEVSVIFQQQPKTSGNGHYGSRLVFAADGSLFVTLGERQLDSPSNPTLDHAQNLNKHLGKIVRIKPDGTPYAGNPTWGGASALPQIWSTGHRNVQGAALHPTTGELWVSEHGPQGGDEVNIARAGQNYGWPMRSYGCQYGSVLPNDVCRVNGGVHAPQFVEPLSYWIPYSMAPSGLAFYTSNKLPAWQGKLFMGALASQALWQLTLSGNSVVAREEMFKNTFGRIRDVRQGPDGWLYLLTDESNGQLIRIEL